jgi:hypothetical protein
MKKYTNDMYDEYTNVISEFVIREFVIRLYVIITH